MTEIERKALELVNEVSKEMGLSRSKKLDLDLASHRALLRAIERHEAFRQEVSDTAEHLYRFYGVPIIKDQLERFIITKPDPLVEAVNEAWGWRGTHPDVTENLRAALAKRGLEIREKSDD